MKYYVFFYYDNAGGGRRYILAEDACTAWKKLRRFLNKYHPFRRYHIRLEQVMPAYRQAEGRRRNRPREALR